MYELILHSYDILNNTLLIQMYRTSAITSPGLISFFHFQSPLLFSKIRVLFKVRVLFNVGYYLRSYGIWFFFRHNLQPINASRLPEFIPSLATILRWKKPPLLQGHQPHLVALLKVRAATEVLQVVVEVEAGFLVVAAVAVVAKATAATTTLTKVIMDLFYFLQLFILCFHCGDFYNLT